MSDQLVEQLMFEFGPARGPLVRFERTLHEAECLLNVQKHVARAWPRLAHRLRLKSLGLSIELMDDMLLRPREYWRFVRKDGERYYVPQGPLLILHRRLKKYFQRRAEKLCSPVVAAWMPGCSIIENAERHRHNRSALRLDYRNAFESVKKKHILSYLLRQSDTAQCTMQCPRPPLLFSIDECWVIAGLLTYRGRLRKGSPISPLVFNLLQTQVDDALADVLGWYPEIVYSRYGDDMCFSCPKRRFPRGIELAIRRVLSEYGVVLSERKTRRSGGGRLRLPGVEIVRGKILPDPEYLAEMTPEFVESLTQWQKAGHRGHLMAFTKESFPEELETPWQRLIA